jgi:threonine/homoserine/homoserine lactone efflux protein
VSFEQILAIALFSFVTAITPGPNNTILLATGMNHGFRKAIPFILGIQTGIVIVVSALLLGVNGLLSANPSLFQWLKIIGFAYIIYLAWRIVRAGEVEGQELKKPLGYLQAVPLQFVNPKLWITMTAFSTSLVPPGLALWEYALILAIVVVVKIPGAASWALFGQVLKAMLGDPKRRKIFNVIAAVVLVASMLPSVLSN